MLDSVKITRRQSEIRQALAGLVGKEKPTDDEVRSLEAMDLEFRTNETRFRAALIAEDTERREAGADLETRSDRQWAELIGAFEMRQVALALDEGRTLDGRTAEVVQELRSKGGYRGIPVPWLALEQRAGETIASGVPNPLQTRPIIDRLFPDSVAAKMGAQSISIDSGLTEWPVVTSSVTAGWATTETGAVAAAAAYATTDKAMDPNKTLGIQMKITRRAMKQTGDALEQAVRRDMNGAIAQAMDLAVFRGAGASGEPLGVLTTPATYGITTTAIAAAASPATAFRGLTAFRCQRPGAAWRKPCWRQRCCTSASAVTRWHPGRAPRPCAALPSRRGCCKRWKRHWRKSMTWPLWAARSCHSRKQAPMKRNGWAALSGASGAG
jgi:HK97 family phage major capsid protein